MSIAHKAVTETMIMAQLFNKPEGRCYDNAMWDSYGRKASLPWILSAWLDARRSTEIMQESSVPSPASGRREGMVTAGKPRPIPRQNAGSDVRGDVIDNQNINRTTGLRRYLNTASCGRTGPLKAGG